MRRHRDARIDEARGIATLLVVVFHAVKAEPSLAPTLFYQVNETLTYVRMPLFMIVTGYLLGTRDPPGGVGAQLRSLRPWIVRIAWPLVTVTACCVAIHHARGEAWPIGRALLFGIWHLWYLQALILLKIAYVALDAWRRPTAPQMIALSIAAALFAHSGIADGLTFFSFDRAIDLLPFLLFGAWVGRTPAVLDRTLLFRLFYVVAAALIVQRLTLYGDSPSWSRTSWAAMLIGAGAGLFVLNHAPRSGALSLVGRYGFPIFLWHLPWFVVVEHLIIPCGLSAMPGVAVRVAAGLLMPAIVARWARSWRSVSIVPVGAAAPRRRRPEAAEPTRSGYGSPLRRFAPGMNHPC